MKKENVVLFAFAVSFALLLSTIVLTKSDDDDTNTAYDLSGHGICSTNTISVTNASYWVQFPSRNQPPKYYNNMINANFTGRNAIVWNANGSTFKTFKIANVSTPLIYSTQDLEINGSCHFTLDSTELVSVSSANVKNGKCSNSFDAGKALPTNRPLYNDLVNKTAPRCVPVADQLCVFDNQMAYDRGLSYTGFCQENSDDCPSKLPCLTCPRGYMQQVSKTFNNSNNSLPFGCSYLKGKGPLATACAYECVPIPPPPPPALEEGSYTYNCNFVC